MEKLIDEGRLSAAQTAWERARLHACGVGTVAQFSVRPTVLAEAKLRLDGSPFLTDMELLLANRFCGQETLVAVAGFDDEVLALTAAAHQHCPADVAVETVRTKLPAVSTMRHLAFLPEPALRIALDTVVDVAGWAPIHSGIADAVAVANEGFVSDHTSVTVRNWLERRTPAALEQMVVETCAQLAGRADLSDDETVTCVKVLTSGVTLSWYEMFVATYQLSFSAAMRLLLMPEVRDELPHVAGRSFTMLLRDRSLEEQIELACQAAAGWRWSKEKLDLVRRTSPDLTALSIWFAVNGRDAGALGEFLAKLAAMPLTLGVQSALRFRMSAPTQLLDLSDSQLDLFASLAPQFRGPLSDLLELCRTLS